MSVNNLTKINHVRKSVSRYERGAVFTYILASLVALSVLAAMVSSLSEKAVTAERYKMVRDDVRSSILSIRNQVLLCRTLFPASGLPTGTTALVTNLECPGVTTANKNLWSSINGNIPPKNISGLNGWRYTLDGTGAYIENTATQGASSQEASILSATSSKLSPQAEMVNGGDTIRYWILKY